MIQIGTSGWHYDSWRGRFFPQELMIKHQLWYYATQFSSTELNGVFYRTPTTDAVKVWRDTTPSDFVFAWKASKFITHWKRLGPSCKNSLRLMESRLKILREKAGPVLFQLPPHFPKNIQSLCNFMDMLNPKRRHVFEFRHPTWYSDDVFRALEDNDAALCISDHHDAPAPWVITASHVYIRGHGPTGRYRGSYPQATLSAWARKIKRWRREYDIFVYFDNDQKSKAPFDASRLKGELLGARR